jgi:hypothetical protein
MRLPVNPVELDELDAVAYGRCHRLILPRFRLPLRPKEQLLHLSGKPLGAKAIFRPPPLEAAILIRAAAVRVLFYLRDDRDLRDCSRLMNRSRPSSARSPYPSARAIGELRRQLTLDGATGRPPAQ